MKNFKIFYKVVIFLAIFILVPAIVSAGPGDISGAIAPIPPGSINMDWSGPIIPGFSSPSTPPQTSPNLGAGTGNIITLPGSSDGIVCKYYSNSRPISGGRSISSLNSWSARSLTSDGSVDYVECAMIASIGASTQIYPSFWLPSSASTIEHFATTSAGRIGVSIWIENSTATPSPGGSNLPGSLFSGSGRMLLGQKTFGSGGYSEPRRIVNQISYSGGNRMSPYLELTGFDSGAPQDYAQVIVEFIINKAQTPSPTPSPTPTPTPTPTPPPQTPPPPPPPAPLSAPVISGRSECPCAIP